MTDDPDDEKRWFRVENPEMPGDSLAQGYEKACDVADDRCRRLGVPIHVFSIAFRGGRKHLRYTAKPKRDTLPDVK